MNAILIMILLFLIYLTIIQNTNEMKLIMSFFIFLYIIFILKFRRNKENFKNFEMPYGINLGGIFVLEDWFLARLAHRPVFFYCEFVEVLGYQIQLPNSLCDLHIRQ